MPKRKRSTIPSAENIEKMKAGRALWNSQQRQRKEEEKEEESRTAPPPAKSPRLPNPPKGIIDPKKSQQMKLVWRNRYQEQGRRSERATNALRARLNKRSDENSIDENRVQNAAAKTESTSVAEPSSSVVRRTQSAEPRRPSNRLLQQVAAHSAPPQYPPNPRRPPLQTLRCPISEISKGTLAQRMRRLREMVPQYMIDTIDYIINQAKSNQRLTVDQALKLCVQLGLSQVQFRLLAKVLKSAVPGAHAVYDRRSEIVQSAGFAELVFDSDGFLRDSDDSTSQQIESPPLDTLNTTESIPYDDLNNTEFTPYDDLNTTESTPYDDLNTTESTPYDDLNNDESTPYDDLNNDESTPYDDLNNDESTPYDDLNNDESTPYDDLNNDESTPYDDLNNIEATPFDDQTDNAPRRKKKDGLRRPLRKILEELIHREKNTNLPSNLRVTISGDCGGDEKNRTKSTKITVFLNDVEYPESPYKLGVYSIFKGTDSYKTLCGIVRKLDAEIHELQSDGLNVDGRTYTPIFFLTGDIKFILIVLGLQCASSTRPCYLCWMKKSEMNNYDPRDPPKLRSVEELQENAESLKSQMAADSRKYKHTEFRIELGSVFDSPLLTSIPLNRISLPCLHLIAGCVNMVLEGWYEKDKIMVNKLLKAAKVHWHQQTSELSGKAGQTLLHHIAKFPVRTNECKYLTALRSIGDLMALAKIGADLTDAERIVRKVIQQLKDIHNVTPKVHLVEAHLLPFIGEHGSWGLFSEQSTESVHRVANKTFVRMPSGDTSQRARLFMTDQLIRQFDD